MLEIEFYGHAVGGSGYGTVSSYVLTNLLKKNVIVKFGDAQTHFSKFVDERLIQFANLSRQIVLKDPVKLFVVTPDLIPITAFNGRTANYTVFEADRLCDNWAAISNLIGLNIVPTEFSRQTWINSGIPEEKVRIAAEGTDLSLYNEHTQALDLKYRGVSLAKRFKHRFILIAEYTKRKNIDFLLSAFIKAFEGREDVCLVLKSNFDPAAYGVYSFPLEKANIFLYETFLPDSLMANFSAFGTHYVSVSHGEGWDINCVNAGALRKTIVVPNHSAYADYLTGASAYMVDSYKVPAIQSKPYDVYYSQHARWWSLKEDDLISKMRASTASDNTEMKENFYKTAIQYTWERTSATILAHLEEHYGK